MLPRIYDSSWYEVLYQEYRKQYFKDLDTFLTKEKSEGKIILPFPSTDIFRAFDLCPLDAVKVVILGQDPYINLGQSNGLAFSVQRSEKLPPSLKNLFRELKSDLGVVNEHGDLTHWALQGVLLLNTVLTVERGKSNSHVGKGWEQFTDEAIRATCLLDTPVVYCLFGKYAQMKKDLINNTRIAPTLIIEAPHPSPLSAYKGFFWSKPFSTINGFLLSNGLRPINWKL